MTVSYIGNSIYLGLDADTKPTTGVATNSLFIETDTGEISKYNGSSWDLIVGRTKTETLTNKTLTSPIISTISNTGTITLPTATTTLVGRDTTDILTNKTLTAPVISTISNTGTVTLFTTTDTVVGRATTDTLTNKTLTNPTINGETRASVSKTGAYTLTSSDRHIRADASGGGFTIDLPTASGITGKIYKIKKIDSTNNIVIIDASTTETIEGMLTWELRNPFDFVEVISDGTNWNVVDYTEPSIHVFRRKGTTENRWYIGGMVAGGTMSTGAVVADNVYASPFMVGAPITLNDMGVNVVTGAALTNVRIGIYKDKNNYPADLVVEAGEVATATSSTFASVALGTPQKLQPGLYWFTIAVSGGPTLRYITTGQFVPLLGLNNTAGTTAPNTGWTHAFTYATLPSTFPSSSPAISGSNFPAIYARFV